MPKLVGKYELGKILGEGTFGKVRHAVNTETGDRVAIKILDKEKIIKQNMGEQVKREISIMKIIKHENVVKLYEVLASKHKIFIVLELVTGGELYDKIVAEGRLNELQARFYFRQLIKGVSYCHSQGVCHRDLKPENLLLDSVGNLKISDFGLSRLTGSGSKEILSTACGTPNYVAPEVISGKGYEGSAADVWSCGVILYVLLAGQLPFDEPTLSALFNKIQRGEYRMPSHFTDPARDLIRRVLVPDPSKRMTMDDIKKHPWFLEGEGELPESIPVPAAPPVAPKARGAGGAGGGGAAGGGDEDEDEDFLGGVADDAKEGEEPEEEASKPTALNAFDLVNMFAGFALNRLLASDEERRVVVTNQFLTADAPATLFTRAQTAIRATGAEVKKMEVKGLKLDAEVLTKNGIVTLTVAAYKVTERVHLMEVRRGRGDLLMYQRVFADVRRAIDPKATAASGGGGAGGGGGGGD